MTLWLTITAIGLITFLLRFSFIYLLSKRDVPRWAQRLLTYVPIAVFSALISPALFLPGSAITFSAQQARLLAGLVAIAVAWRTRNVMLTISAGMATLWLLQIWLH